MPNQYTGYPPRDKLFWAKVNKTSTCWLWTAAIDTQGYGVFWNEGHIRAHQFLVGKAPKGFNWDHLCRVRACVRPSHLEMVTAEENGHRGLMGALKSDWYAAHPVCKNGHPKTPENIRQVGGLRICKVCMNERKRRWRQAQKA